MSSDATNQLLRKLRAQRETWCDLGDGLAVCVRRPLEVDFGRLGVGIVADHVIEYACDWRGFTEATLLGAGIGSADAVPFSRELWSEWISDNAARIEPVARAIVQAVQQHLDARQADAGN